MVKNFKNCYFCEILNFRYNNSRKNFVLKKSISVENLENCHFLRKNFILRYECYLTECTKKVFFAKIWILEINFRILSERIGRGMSGKFNIQNVDLQFILVKAEFVNVNAQKRTRIETSSFVLNPGYTQPIVWPYLTSQWPQNDLNLDSVLGS